MATFYPHYDVRPDGSKIYYADAIPSSFTTTGTSFFPGDTCYNIGTTDGQTYAWLYTSAGVWVAQTMTRHWIVVGPLSATSTSLGITIPGGTYQISSVHAVATAKGGSGATVTVETLTGTTAPGSGTAQLTAALVIDGTYTNNTVLAGTLVASPASITGGTGRIGIVLAGTLTGLANLVVTVTLKKLS